MLFKSAQACSGQMAIIFEKALQKGSRVVQFELGKIRVQMREIPNLSVAAAG